MMSRPRSFTSIQTVHTHTRVVVVLPSYKFAYKSEQCSKPLLVDDCMGVILPKRLGIILIL